MKKQVLILFILVVCAGTAFAGSMVRPINLEQMTTGARTIFYGKCVAAEARMDENGLPATRYTFEIQRTLKGQAGSTFSIKQFGFAPTYRPASDRSLSVATVEGMPEYRLGESYLIFLAAVSPMGYSSPQGLGQGAFRTFADTSTKQVLAINGQGNNNLFRGMESKSVGRFRESATGSTESHALPLQDLMSLVQQILSNR